MAKEVYLTEKEIERERNLFAPTKQKYKSLEAKECDIREFEEEASEDANLPQPPSSC